MQTAVHIMQTGESAVWGRKSAVYDSYLIIYSAIFMGSDPLSPGEMDSGTRLAGEIKSDHTEMEVVLLHV